MTNILLLGGTGFIGKSLVSELTKKNSIKMMIHNSNLETSAQKFRGNILSTDSFINEIDDDQLIINLLGQTTSNESDFFTSNILGGLNLLNSCIQKKIKGIILISTINVYGENLERSSKETDQLNPKTTYGIVKMITENIYKQFSEKYGINVTVLRFANIYGPTKKTGFLNSIINSILDKKIIPLCYHKGKQERDLLFINDAIECIKNTIDYDHNGFQIFNISSGNKISINSLVLKIEEITNSKITLEYSSKIPDEHFIWADNTKARKLLDFQPKFDINSGLKSLIDDIL
jgi:nucleoside-diphosphate-sugar epimerase